MNTALLSILVSTLLFTSAAYSNPTTKPGKKMTTPKEQLTDGEINLAAHLTVLQTFEGFFQLANYQTDNYKKSKQVIKKGDTKDVPKEPLKMTPYYLGTVSLDTRASIKSIMLNRQNTANRPGFGPLNNVARAQAAKLAESPEFVKNFCYNHVLPSVISFKSNLQGQSTDQIYLVMVNLYNLIDSVDINLESIQENSNGLYEQRFLVSKAMPDRDLGPDPVGYADWAILRRRIANAEERGQRNELIIAYKDCMKSLRKGITDVLAIHQSTIETEMIEEYYRGSDLETQGDQ